MSDTAAGAPSGEGDAVSRRLERVAGSNLFVLVSNRVTGARTEAWYSMAPGGRFEPSEQFMSAAALIHRELSRNPDLLSCQLRFLPGGGQSL